MRIRCVFAWALAATVGPVSAFASGHHSGGHHHSPVGPMGNNMGQGGPSGRQVFMSQGLGMGGSGWGWYGMPYYATLGPTGPVYIGPTFAPPPQMIFPMVFDREVAVQAPMPANIRRVPVKKVTRVDAAKSAQLVTVGDRLFRAGNLNRAAQRYEQALRADPDAAPPRVRMAQVAVVRGQYSDAAQHIRDAIAADPKWLANAPDIQTMYAEPADFTRQLSRLESRVVVEPSDRDAWLVLGAELYLSGQTRRASDVFVRLTDRKPDQALAAFLDVTTPREKDADPK